MPLHDKAFWAISFFLAGVLLASMVADWRSRFLVPVLVAALGAAIFITFEKRWHAALAAGVVIGSLYYVGYDARQRDVAIPFGNAEVRGVVVKASVGERSQTVVLRLLEPHRGKVRITAQRSPAYAYGDELAVAGTIKQPSEQSAKRLEKDGIFGVMQFPKTVEVIAHGKGSPLKAALLKIKAGAERTFRRALGAEQAAFLAGITLGETAGFTREFRDELSRTGTSHLVALSGYNITIVATNVMAGFAFFFRRRITFILGTLAVVAFVIMTGAEASAVRAAMMASLVLLAGQVGRLYSFRNSIAVAALLMVLANPNVLAWDIGFQLSFAAVLGLVYVSPAIARAIPALAGNGILSWRKNLRSTLSAQLAVLPLLLAQFGTFSIISLLVNVLLLTFIPFTMFLGFAIAGLGIVSDYAAIALGFLANVFLSYELGVIHLFSRAGGVVAVAQFGVALALLYYGGLIAFTAYALRRQRTIHALPYNTLHY